jgi:tetratricopeptide (TPR) repeat protein
MSPEEALEAANEILRAHCGKPLTDIQRMILRESLADKGYKDMKGYELQSIKNEGMELWQLLSKALDEKVSKTNFKGALEKWQKSRSVLKTPPALSVYNSETWVGRSPLINELLPKLQDKTRLVWITGIPGIGKTTLGECLASRAWESNPTFQWVYLEVLEGQGADFTTVAADLLAKLGDQDLDPQERNDPKRLTDRLIRKLQSSCYWVQLDSLERLLNPELGTEFADAHWVTFLQRCLTEQDFGSRLVLTAQALPSALVEFADSRPNFWEAITLVGLSAEEAHNEHLEFFGKHGVVVDDSNRVTLCKLGQLYEGHTLVLRVISGEIKSLYKGNVAQYWENNQQEFEQVSRSLESKRLNQTEYNKQLSGRVRNRVKGALEKLPTDAKDLLLRSSVYRRPVSEKFWLSMIEERSGSKQEKAYQMLLDRALVEQENNHTLIRQHNLICDVAYDLLKQVSFIWETAERQAAELWRTAYESPPGLPNLETLRGYLEAFEHYYVLEDWDAIRALVTNPINTPSQSTLSKQLNIWSYFHEEIRLCQRLLGKCGVDIDFQCWKGIGNGYFRLGNYPRAIQGYENCLKIAQAIGDRRGEGIALGNLGIAYDGLGQHERAIDYHQQALIISRMIADRRSEGNVLGNLGLAYKYRKQYEHAIDFYQQDLAIKQETGDRAGEGRTLGNLGTAYHILGQYERAIDFHQQNLKLARETGNILSEGHALGNLGVTQIDLKLYPEALENFCTVLEIFRQIGARNGEAETLKYLAELHQTLGEIPTAQQYCQQSLELAVNLGIPLAEECRQLMAQLEPTGVQPS